MSINDDGDLYRKYRQKRDTSKARGIQFNLSYEDWVFLVAEANLKSSQLGQGAGYVLARYEDSGPYEIGNCRWVPYSINNRERNITDKLRTALRKNAEKAAAVNRAQGKRNREAYEASAHPSYLNERNSQHGTKWITDGKINRKIQASDTVPEGFRYGRVGQGLNLKSNKGQ